MILVMGVGRTGTSTTSRILHTKLGVCMGHHPDLEKPKPGNPLGSYEDVTMIRATKNLLRGATTTEWLKEFNIHDEYPCLKPYIGCKVTRLAGITPKQLIGINPKLVIRTFRPKELAVASLQRYRDNTTDWGGFYDGRENDMDKMQQETDIPFFTIKYGTTRKSDLEVEEELQTALDLYL